MNQEQLIEELKKLGMLHDSGVLSDKEFQEMKSKLLGQLNGESRYSNISIEAPSGEGKPKATNASKEGTTFQSKGNPINDLNDKVKYKKTAIKDNRSGLSKKTLLIVACIAVLIGGGLVFYYMAKKPDPIHAIGVRIGNFAAHNQVDSLKTYYPDADQIESLYLDFSPDKMEISPDGDDGKYNIKFSDSASASVQVYDDNSFKILSSNGLFAFRSEDILFAEKAGMLKDTNNDIETAKRINEIPILRSFIYEEYVKQLDNQLTVSKDATYTSSMYTSSDGMSHGYYTVTNTGKKDVLAGDYTLVWEDGYYMFMGSDVGYETSSTKRSEAGKQSIPAGESVRCEFVIGDNHESKVLVAALINKKDQSEFFANYLPSGEEYKRFISGRSN